MQFTEWQLKRLFKQHSIMRNGLKWFLEDRKKTRFDSRHDAVSSSRMVRTAWVKIQRICEECTKKDK